MDIVRPTSWDLRAFLRALGAASIALVVVWLITATSDEGQVTAASRAERTLPLAPLCSAVAAALALGTGRVREETRALEAVGRSPSASAIYALIGAALPSLIIALLVASFAAIDVGAFYPTTTKADAFQRESHAFASPTLGVRVADVTGEPETIPIQPATDASLPRGARTSAALATALAGIALAMMAARAAQSASLLGSVGRRRRQFFAIAAGATCAVFTVVAFQAAAAGHVPPLLATMPALILLGVALVGYRADNACRR